MKVKDLMKYPVITINLNDNIEKALNIMGEQGINGMPVVDKEGHLVGMVVKADIYRFLTTPGHYEVCPVEWVMAKKVIAVEPETDFLEAAQKLRDHDIIAMPVVIDSKVVGIISIEDMLDYFLGEKNLVIQKS